jgi:hypothetical protein
LSTATLTAAYLQDLELVVLLSLDGAPSTALSNTFFFDPKSNRVVILTMSMFLRESGIGGAYFVETERMAKFVGIEVVFRPLFE